MSHTERLKRAAALPLITACSILPGGNVTAQGLNERQTIELLSIMQGKRDCITAQSFTPDAENGVATIICGFRTGASLSYVMDGINAAKEQSGKMPDKLDVWLEELPRAWRHTRFDVPHIMEYSAKLARQNITPENVYIIPGAMETFNLVSEEGKPDMILLTTAMIANNPADAVVDAIVRAQQKSRQIQQRPQRGGVTV